MCSSARPRLALRRRFSARPSPSPKDVTGWKTQPRFVRKLSDNSICCQATLAVKKKLVLCPRNFPRGKKNGLTDMNSVRPLRVLQANAGACRP